VAFDDGCGNSQQRPTPRVELVSSLPSPTMEQTCKFVRCESRWDREACQNVSSKQSELFIRTQRRTRTDGRRQCFALDPRTQRSAAAAAARFDSPSTREREGNAGSPGSSHRGDRSGCDVVARYRRAEVKGKKYPRDGPRRCPRRRRRLLRAVDRGEDDGRGSDGGAGRS
jgi:hypothetical protein